MDTGALESLESPTEAVETTLDRHLEDMQTAKCLPPLHVSGISAKQKH